MASASSAEFALTQRSTQVSWVSMRRKPQCTTSWSSTTSTRRREGLRVPSAIDRHHEPDLPGARAALAELDHAAHLERLEGGEAQAHAGPVTRGGDAVVDDVHDEGAVLAA